MEDPVADLILDTLIALFRQAKIVFPSIDSTIQNSVDRQTLAEISAALEIAFGVSLGADELVAAGTVAGLASIVRRRANV